MTFSHGKPDKVWGYEMSVLQTTHVPTIELATLASYALLVGMLLDKALDLKFRVRSSDNIPTSDGIGPEC